MQSFTKQTALPLSTQFLCVCVCAQVAMPGHYTDDVREAGQSATFASNRDTPCHPPLVILIVTLSSTQTWNLSKILHTQIFRLKVLHRKSA